MEFFVTFFLVWAIFAGAAGKGHGHREISVLVFAAITMGIMMAGPTTGGALNPCRVFGPALVAGDIAKRGSWIYYVGPMLGGAVAGLLSLVFFPPKKEENFNRVSAN